MTFKPSAWMMVFACLVGVAACNRPTTEVMPATWPAKAARLEVGMSLEDALITRQVKSALVAADDINGKAILVTTREGQVTLSGSVPVRQIERAEEVARNVDGVRGVDNKLRPVGIMT